MFVFSELNQMALALAKQNADKLMQNSTQNRKQTHSATQDKINILINDIKLYEKGLKLFPADKQPQLIRYLLKTLGIDVLSEFCKYAAGQCNITIQDESMTPDQRNKIINDLSDEYKKPLTTLHATLSELNIDSFLQSVDLCLTACGMILKKVDKKKDKYVILNLFFS